MLNSGPRYTLTAMQSTHRLYCADSRRMEYLSDNSVDLIVTSPPYPMIAMWDDQFALTGPQMAASLSRGDGQAAWEAMHRQLDRTWEECARVLKPGGFICVNIGDATRSVNGSFQLYSNHSRIITALQGQGLITLPLILWRKQTNSPTKFMGSGMLPAGAYVTLEHEYILIFRKGQKRCFQSEAERGLRRRSALFWEERNRWFSDVWDFKGSRQNHNGPRERSGAFPFELAYRLIHMYSVQNDVVLDPFAGTGTSMLAAMAGGRHSIGIEIEPELIEHTRNRLSGSTPDLNDIARNRLDQHRVFIEEYAAGKGVPNYTNEFYGFPVITSQEQELKLPCISRIDTHEKHIVTHHDWEME